jgi:mannose/cellobiose epimerase-like protein (N-acyl-D-glucosamine 2-epimerase family)
VLCNDGTRPPVGGRCPGHPSWLSQTRQTLVGQSRQVYSFAVAFHMTGEARYLDLARKGVSHQFDTFLEQTGTNLFVPYADDEGGSPAMFAANAQQQAYGLLGPTMLYYLTGDADLYARIEAIQAAVDDAFRFDATGAYSRNPGGPARPVSPNLVDHLDQLNAYMTMLGEFSPTPDNAVLVDKAARTAAYIRETFHDSTTGMVLLDAGAMAGDFTRTDLGHTIKTYWFMDQIARLAGDLELRRFARAEAARAFALGFDDATGAWLTKFDASGMPTGLTDWWQYAEASQFLASLAAEDPALAAMLDRAQAYWMANFVDAAFGGIHWELDIAAGTPTYRLPKHWEWKAGFHSFEHALVNHLGDAARDGSEVTLFFARSDGTMPGLSYGFQGRALAGAAEAGGVQSVTFADIAYGRMAPVPLPAGVWLLLAALTGLACLRRRAAS